MGGWLLALASGGLFALAFPPADCGSLGFVALAPLVLAVAGRSIVGAGARAWLVGTIGCTLLVGPSLFVAARGYFGESLMVPLGLALGLSQLHGALPIALFGLGARALLAVRAPPLGLLVTLPTLWVATEMLRAELGYGVPWILLAHGQHARPWILQIADLGGAAAVSWVVAFVNVGLALVVGPARSWRERGGIVAAVGIVSLAVYAYGIRQLAVWHAPAAPSVRVALVQPAVPEEWRRSLTDVPRVVARLQTLTRAVAASHPLLVVWPENAVSVPIDANPQLVGDLEDGLDPGTLVLVGGSRVAASAPGAPGLRNSAFLLDRRGAVVDVYDKRRLTPFGEYVPWLARPFSVAPDLYGPGAGAGLLAVGDHRVGTTICAEAIDADLVRHTVRAGADLLVNIAHDGWFAGTAARAQHFHAAALRAVEHRRILLRATSDGLTAIVDARGIVVQVAPVGTPATLVATVPAIRTRTVYARIGDAFGWTCVALTLAVLFHAGRRARS